MAIGITTKKKDVKPVVSKPDAPENKFLSKEDYVEKNEKAKERRKKLSVYNAKLIADEKVEVEKESK